MVPLPEIVFIAEILFAQSRKGAKSRPNVHLFPLLRSGQLRL